MAESKRANHHAALRTNPAFRPSHPLKMGEASGLIGEAIEERNQGSAKQPEARALTSIASRMSRNAARAALILAM